MLFEVPRILRFLSGTLERDVEAKADTQTIWANLHKAAEARGLELKGVGIQDVNQVRSALAHVREAGRLLAKALDTAQTTGLDQAISGEMIGRSWWGNDITTQLTAPTYRLEVEWIVKNPDYGAGIEGAPEFVSKWTGVTSSTRPSTTSEIQEWIDETAQIQADKYHGEVVRMGRIRLVTQ
jgi:hypothetical protein